MVVCGGEIPKIIYKYNTWHSNFGIMTFEKQMLDGFQFATEATSFTSFQISLNNYLSLNFSQNKDFMIPYENLYFERNFHTSNFLCNFNVIMTMILNKYNYQI